MTTSYDKDGAYIEVTTDGVVHRRSIKWKDCVVSVPSGANLKIDSAYVNESDQLVLVLEDDSEVIMASAEDLGTHDTDIKALLAIIAAYIDTEVAAILAAVDTEVAAIETKLDTPANFMANVSALALEATLTAIKGGGWSTQTLVAIKAAIDAITGAVSTDWKGSFNWDTSAYTTVEQDISALFSTNLALATRRKYSVKLDLTTVEADASFVSLYLAVKEKVDGTNYRAIDRKTVLKADIAATAEPGIVIDIPATSENVQITMQMTTALAGDATIYYAVVKEHLE